MRTVLATGIVVGLAVACGTAASATTGRAASHMRERVAAGGDTKDLSGHRWRHRVQVDGAGGRDRVVIVGGKDLRVNGIGGTGHITVSVRLHGTHRRASKRVDLSYYNSPHKHWTPWYGATNLDRVTGKELLVGSTSGAHTQVFTALTYRAGALRKLHAPGGKHSYWSVNSSYGTGNEGWRCTREGVESRSVYPKNRHHTRFRVVRDKYKYGSGHWTRTDHAAATVPSGRHGSPPKSTRHYASFACAGLPNAFQAGGSA
jgi:hypothetical protein